MALRWSHWLVIVAFAVSVGHLAWQAMLGPAALPRYFVGGSCTALASPPSTDKLLYLRRELYLSQRPRHAWLQVVAKDRVVVYLNGELMGERDQAGVTAAVLVDLTPYLQLGRNVIAVATKQMQFEGQPVVAIEGAYTLSDGEHSLGAAEQSHLNPDDQWRYSTFFDRKAAWWFDTQFDHRQWQPARLSAAFLRGTVRIPPRAITAASTALWITPATLDERVSVRREFEVAGRPRQAWLRVTSTASYKLAVNGILLDEQEDQLGTREHFSPVQRIYDITTAVQQGRNIVALSLTALTGPPHLKADLEVEDQTGHRLNVSTDGSWLGRSGNFGGWLDPQPSDPSAWVPCLAESGDLDIPPWIPPRQVISISELTLPLPVIFRRWAEELGLIGAIALVTLLACRVASRFLSPVRQGLDGSGAGGLTCLALVPPTLAIGTAVLATFDPRIGPQEIYRQAWVWLAVLSVPLQWALLAMARSCWERSKSSGIHRLQGLSFVGWASCLVAVLMGIGFWLRVRDMAAEPLHPDEVMVYRAAQGFLERGLPSYQIDEDLPPSFLYGNELIYFGPALMSLVCDQDRYIVRFPPVCWGVLTIVAIFATGRRMFGTEVGLIAAAIYTFAPHCIQMAWFGRYPSMLQLVTLVTILFYYRTIAGPGPINRRYLWLTALSFVTTFLCWEAGALIAPGMVLAVLVERRGRLRELLHTPAVYAAMLVVLGAVALQTVHRTLQLTQSLTIGTGTIDVSLMPMWPFPYFRLWYYVWPASWSRDALLPMLGLLGGAVLALRHPFRRSARMLLLILLPTCFLMSGFLSVISWRYAYHVTPLLILLSSAALLSGARGLVRLGSRLHDPPPYKYYSRGIAGLLVVTLIVVGSGIVLHLDDMTWLAIEGPLPGWFRLGLLKIVDGEGPVRYLRDHIQEGDIVISLHPAETNYFMSMHGGHPSRADWHADFWLEDTLFVEAVLDDRQSIPLHHYSGTVMLSNKEQLEDVLARHDRVWYITVTTLQDYCNSPEVARVLRDHMDVVFEGFNGLLLFKGNNNRPANLRQDNELKLQKAKANPLLF